MDNQEKKSVGPVIGLVVIIVIILIGGIYFWSARETGNEGTGSPQNPALNTNENDDTNSTLPPTTNSTEPGDIEADLNSFNSAGIDSVDSDL